MAISFVFGLFSAYLMFRAYRMGYPTGIPMMGAGALMMIGAGLVALGALVG